MTVTNNIRAELLSTRSRTATKLDHCLWKPLRELGLSKKELTARGCRGSSRKRIIRTMVGSRSTRNLRHLAVCSQNKQRLRSLPREPYISVPTVPLDFKILNLRCSNNKGDQVVEYVADNDVDVVALTDTWLQKNSSDARRNLTPAGCTLYDEPRLKPKKRENVKKKRWSRLTMQIQPNR